MAPRLPSYAEKQGNAQCSAEFYPLAEIQCLILPMRTKKFSAESRQRVHANHEWQEKGSNCFATYTVGEGDHDQDAQWQQGIVDLKRMDWNASEFTERVVRKDNCPGHGCFATEATACQETGHFLDREHRWKQKGNDAVKTHGWNSKREGIDKHAWQEGDWPSPVATLQEMGQCRMVEQRVSAISLYKIE